MDSAEKEMEMNKVETQFWTLNLITVGLGMFGILVNALAL